MVNVKVVILGDGNVGKTSLKNRFIGLPVQIDYKATIGADFGLKYHKYDTGEKKFDIKFMVYDLAGQPRYSSIRAQYMTGTQAALFVYDITDKISYDTILSWLDEFKKVVTYDVPIVLVANKVDLRKTWDRPMISTAEGEELKGIIEKEYYNNEEGSVFFIETSAIYGTNVNKAFDCISEFIYTQYLKQVST